MLDKSVSLVVMSCDKYEDILDIFFHFKNKYWSDCPYETYILTETKVFNHAKTITQDYPLSQWTTRIRKSLEQIDTKYILFVDSDFFIRSKVNQDRINYCIDNFDDDTIVYNFELGYELCESDKLGFALREDKSKWLCSCQPSLWNREKLIKLLEVELDPWGWEEQIIDCNGQKFYINISDIIIDIGYYRKDKSKKNYGVRKGKWVKEDVVNLFAKEGIKINYDIRGFYEGS